MKQKPLSEMTIEELQKNEKLAKTAAILLGASIGIMLLTGIFLSLRKGFSAFSVLPVAFFPLFAVNIRNWKKMKAEIASRK
jgi:hypothetical protein